MRLSSSSYLNAKLYKAFCNNCLSVSLQADDIFNKSTRDVVFYNKDVTYWQNMTATAVPCSLRCSTTSIPHGTDTKAKVPAIRN